MVLDCLSSFTKANFNYFFSKPPRAVWLTDFNLNFFLRRKKIIKSIFLLHAIGLGPSAPHCKIYLKVKCAKDFSTCKHILTPRKQQAAVGAACCFKDEGWRTSVLNQIATMPTRHLCFIIFSVQAKADVNTSSWFCMHAVFTTTCSSTCSTFYGIFNAGLS